MTSLREQWVEFIRSPDHAGRYLYAGRKSRYVDAEAFSAERLEEFLGRLSKPTEDIKLLSRIYYLFQPSVRDFFQNRLLELVRSASHVSESELEVSRRGVRGKILWPQTSRMRASGKGDSSTFVVRKGVKSSNVPENRLLKLYLSDVAATVVATTRTVGTQSMPEELEHLGHAAADALKTPYLREVQSTYKATSVMRRRAHRHRNRSYGEMADLQLRYDLALREQKWSFILTLLQKNWLEPVSDDNLFELYILVLILDVLANECGFGEPERYGLIRRDREAVAEFGRDNITVKVHFDQSPVTFAEIGSEYLAVFEDYPDFKASPRRPDITIQFDCGDGVKQYLLIEVKKSEDDNYGRNSVYKVLGYLQDFAELWVEAVPQFPKAVLVFPQGMTQRQQAEEKTKDLVLISGGNRERLAEILLRRFGTNASAARPADDART